MFFGGKIFKITSALSAMATAKFLSIAVNEWPERVAKRLPTFDARVFQVPDEVEAMNAIYWRVLDARKNAISMAARAHFSPKELHGKRGSQMIDMLHEKGVAFEKYPQFFRQGSFIKRIQEVRLTTAAEQLQMAMMGGPIQETVTRHAVVVMKWPDFNTLANRVDVLFYNAEPVLKDVLSPSP